MYIIKYNFIGQDIMGKKIKPKNVLSMSESNDHADAIVEPNA